MKPFNSKTPSLMLQLIIQSMKREKFPLLKDQLKYKLLLRLKQKKRKMPELLKN